MIQKPLGPIVRHLQLAIALSCLLPGLARAARRAGLEGSQGGLALGRGARTGVCSGPRVWKFRALHSSSRRIRFVPNPRSTP